LSAARRRGDPYADLYYELDMKNGGVGSVSCENFEWDRAKSNLNVKEKGFSFYLARTIFYDRAKTIFGDTEIVNGESRVKMVGHPFGLEYAGLLVMVSVVLDKEGLYRRIISAWENESPYVERAYEKSRRWVINSDAVVERNLRRMMGGVKPSSNSDPLWRFRSPRNKDGV
jgi:uncharacterized DUF497 family protein